MNKFIFANQLRGLAALSVIISHWFGIYWAMPEVVATYTLSPVQSEIRSVAFDLVSHQYFNFGATGVAIFFLVSGFVIPFSIEKNKPSEFLIARFFRIFPTYLIGLIVSLTVVWLSGKFWGKQFLWNKETIISNAFLYFNMVGLPTVDLINWTLVIEVKFYFLAALLSTAIIQGKTIPLFIFSIFNLIFAWKIKAITDFIGSPIINTSIHNLIVDFIYIEYMIIGIFFHYAIKSRISTLKLIILSVVQLSIFTATWGGGGDSNLSDQFPMVTLNYYYGFIIFGVAYIFREKFKPTRWIDWLADISYPLYIIHSLIGYSTIKFLMHYNYPFFISVIVAMLITSFVAHTIHVFIEIPSTALGKKLPTLLWRKAGHP